MTENLTASQDAANGTKGFRFSVIFRHHLGGPDADNGNDGEAVSEAIPPKKPAATRIRHRVSGTNRRARSA
jgi:hypothetical protein